MVNDLFHFQVRAPYFERRETSHDFTLSNVLSKAKTGGLIVGPDRVETGVPIAAGVAQDKRSRDEYESDDDGEDGMKSDEQHDTTPSSKKRRTTDNDNDEGELPHRLNKGPLRGKSEFGAMMEKQKHVKLAAIRPPVDAFSASSQIESAKKDASHAIKVVTNVVENDQTLTPEQRMDALAGIQQAQTMIDGTRTKASDTAINKVERRETLSTVLSKVRTGSLKVGGPYRVETGVPILVGVAAQDKRSRDEYESDTAINVGKVTKEGEPKKEGWLSALTSPRKAASNICSAFRKVGEVCASVASSSLEAGKIIANEMALHVKNNCADMLFLSLSTSFPSYFVYITVLHIIYKYYEHKHEKLPAIEDLERGVDVDGTPVSMPASVVNKLLAMGGWQGVKNSKYWKGASESFAKMEAFQKQNENTKSASLAKFSIKWGPMIYHVVKSAYIIAQSIDKETVGKLIDSVRDGDALWHTAKQAKQEAEKLMWRVSHGTGSVITSVQNAMKKAVGMETPNDIFKKRVAKLADRASKDHIISKVKIVLKDAALRAQKTGETNWTNSLYFKDVAEFYSALHDFKSSVQKASAAKTLKGLVRAIKENPKLDTDEAVKRAIAAYEYDSQILSDMSSESIAKWIIGGTVGVVGLAAVALPTILLKVASRGALEKIPII